MLMSSGLRMIIWRIVTHSVPVGVHCLLWRTERRSSSLIGDIAYHRLRPGGFGRLVALIGVVGGLRGNSGCRRQHNGEDQMFDFHLTTPFLTRNIVRQFEGDEISFPILS